MLTTDHVTIHQILFRVQKIYKEILVISNKIKQDQKDNDVAAKWKMAAMVMFSVYHVISYLMFDVDSR